MPLSVHLLGTGAPTQLAKKQRGGTIHRRLLLLGGCSWHGPGPALWVRHPMLRCVAAPVTLLRHAAKLVTGRRPPTCTCAALAINRRHDAPQRHPAGPHACANCRVHCRATSIASPSLAFQCLAMASSSGSSGLGALISAWMLQAHSVAQGRL